MNIKSRVEQGLKKNAQEWIDLWNRLCQVSPATRQQVIQEISQKWGIPFDQVKPQMSDAISTYEAALGTCEASKVILFSAEQARVFDEASKDYSDALEYKLPFPRTLLYFDESIVVANEKVYGFLLDQFVVNDDNKAALLQEHERLQKLGIDIKNAKSPFLSSPDGTVVNAIVVILENYKAELYEWQQGSFDEFLFMGNTIDNLATQARKLAICCIGFINLKETVYLQETGGVPESVNAKRAQKGKTLVEPYYLCRIHGVNYGNTNSVGGGTHHGFRYDVRGHFRYYKATGLVKWIRPHQRGLQNELYIPKTYKVDKHG